MATCIPWLLLPSVYQLQALVKNNNYPFFFVSPLLALGETLWECFPRYPADVSPLLGFRSLGSGCTNALA